MIAGERKRRRARETGRVVVLVDARESLDYDEVEGGRWVTLCEEHGTFVQHEGYRTAKSFLSSPSDWCVPCREAGPTENAGRREFSEEDRAKAIEARRRKAEERRLREEAEAKAAAEAKIRSDVVAEWALFRPLFEAVKTEAELEETARLRGTIVERLSEVSKARTELRARREELEGAKPPKPKREKELRAIVPKLEENLVALEAKLEEVYSRRRRLGVRAYLRAAVQHGYRVARNGSGYVLVGAETKLRIPDGYVEPEDLKLVRSEASR